MEIATIKQRIESEIHGAVAHVTGDGCSCAAEVVSEAFAGKSLLEKQRMVMASVQEYIASGELHALSIKTFTPPEWEQHQAGNAP